MNDAERLENIKGKIGALAVFADNEGNGQANLLTIARDMNWLVQQAERVQELKEWKNKALKINQGEMKYRGEITAKYVELKEQNMRYRETLEFYADVRNYLPESVLNAGTNVSKDCGKRAFRALEQSR